MYDRQQKKSTAMVVTTALYTSINGIAFKMPLVNPWDYNATIPSALARSGFTSKNQSSLHLPTLTAGDWGHRSASIRRVTKNPPIPTVLSRRGSSIIGSSNVTASTAHLTKITSVSESSRLVYAIKSQPQNSNSTRTTGELTRTNITSFTTSLTSNIQVTASSLHVRANMVSIMPRAPVNQSNGKPLAGEWPHRSVMVVDGHTL